MISPDSSDLSPIEDEFLSVNQEMDYPCPSLGYYYRGRTRGESVVHQRTCQKCLDWLFENDLARFDLLLRGALSSRVKNLRIISFAASKGCQVNFDEIPEQNILLIQIFLSCKPYKIPQETIDTPDCPGVYMVVVNNQNSTKIAYIGSSLSIRHRLAIHHLDNEFEILIQTGVELSVYCLLFPLNETEEAMRQTEAHLIRELKPSLNKRF